MGSKKRRSKADSRVPAGLIGNLLAQESDRGCVLVACAFLDYYLEVLLREWFSRVDDPNLELINKVMDPTDARAFLFSGWSKSVVARLVGAIDDGTYRLVECIRTLRNDFAHTPGAVALDDAVLEPLLAQFNDEGKNAIDALLNARLEFGSENAAVGLWNIADKDKNFSIARLRFMTISHMAWQLIVSNIRSTPYDGAFARLDNTLAEKFTSHLARHHPKDLDQA